MLRRFFYFPTPTNEGCETALPEVVFDHCNPLLLLSEIRRIFVAKRIAAALSDWTSEAAWTARLNDSTTAGNDYIRTLVVRGNKPAPTGIAKSISNGRTINITKTHVLNFLIDEVAVENHEFMRQNEATSGDVTIWYETHGGLLFGGNAGIKATMILDMVLNEGPEEIMTYNGTFSWKNRITEERIDSPIFDLGNTGTSTVFDTTLEFTGDESDVAAGVTATIAANDPDIEFQFNAITPQVGTPMSMTINLNGIQIMTVDFPDDYEDEGFRFVDTAGVGHIGVFAAGNVNF